MESPSWTPLVGWLELVVLQQVLLQVSAFFFGYCPGLGLEIAGVCFGSVVVVVGYNYLTGYSCCLYC